MAAGELTELAVCWRKPCRAANAVTDQPGLVTCPHCLSARLADELTGIITRLRLLAG